MYALKDKVSERFSSLFSNSTSSESPKPPASDPLTQARPKLKGRKSLSSYLSLVIPSIHGSKSTGSHQDANSVQSPSVQYCDANNEFQEEGSDTFLECSILCKSEEIPSNQGENKDCGLADEKVKLNKPGVDDDPASGHSTSSSEVFEEAMKRSTLRNPLSDLTDESAFISADLYEFLGCCLPNIVKGCKWILLYSTMKHGISLQTLIRNSHNLSGPCLLIVGDTRGAIFGGLLECPLKPTAQRKYQGTNQTFVFTTKYGDPRLFRATGANHYYYICLNDLLALGGGGSFALCLDGDLLSGTSGPCDTFGSLCLAHDPEFELKNVEEGDLGVLLVEGTLSCFLAEKLPVKERMERSHLRRIEPFFSFWQEKNRSVTPPVTLLYYFHHLPLADGQKSRTRVKIKQNGPPPPKRENRGRKRGDSWI